MPLLYKDSEPLSHPDGMYFWLCLSWHVHQEKDSHRSVPLANYCTNCLWAALPSQDGMDPCCCSSGRFMSWSGTIIWKQTSNQKLQIQLTMGDQHLQKQSSYKMIQAFVNYSSTFKGVHAALKQGKLLRTIKISFCCAEPNKRNLSSNAFAKLVITIKASLFVLYKTMVQSTWLMLVLPL